MQQVNLYLDEFAPKPQRLGLRSLLQLLAGVLLLLILIGLFLSQQLSSARQQSAESRQALDAVIAAISQSHGDQLAQQNVAMQLEQLLKQVAEQQALLADLKQREASQTKGFASVLQTLAEQHDARLWLTHIAIRHGSLQLAGETLDAAVVPSWLGRLQTSEPLAGQRFAALSLNRIEDKPGVIAFSVDPGAEHAAISR